AIEEHGDLRGELIAGRFKAIGLANGNGLPVSIPGEHFAIAWKQPTPTAMKPIGGGKPGRLIVHDGPPPWETLPENFLYREPWLDVIRGIIYATDGTPQWTQIRVEAERIERVPLPDMKIPHTLPSRAAAWGLEYLYGKTGYPKNLSMPALTRQVNEALQKDYAPLRLRRRVSSDTVERLLKPRQ